MTTVPLLLNEDAELGALPNYNEAVNGKKTGQTHTSDTTAIPPDFFYTDFGKTATSIGVVALANVSIRLGNK